MTAETLVSTATKKRANKNLSTANHKSNDVHDHDDDDDVHEVDTAANMNKKDKPHPTILIPTTSSSIMKNRLSTYQNGQLGHFNWIVSQYLHPRHQPDQQLSKASVSSSKRSRMELEEHRNLDDINYRSSGSSKQQQQIPSQERETTTTTRTGNHPDNINHQNTVTQQNSANTVESMIQDTDQYKKARHILNQYVDEMRGVNTVDAVLERNTNNNRNHHDL